MRPRGPENQGIPRGTPGACRCRVAWSSMVKTKYEPCHKQATRFHTTSARLNRMMKLFHPSLQARLFIFATFSTLVYCTPPPTPSVDAGDTCSGERGSSFRPSDPFACRVNTLGQGMTLSLSQEDGTPPVSAGGSIIPLMVSTVEDGSQYSSLIGIVRYTGARTTESLTSIPTKLQLSRCGSNGPDSGLAAAELVPASSGDQCRPNQTGGLDCLSNTSGTVTFGLRRRLRSSTPGRTRFWLSARSGREWCRETEFYIASGIAPGDRLDLQPILDNERLPATEGTETVEASFCSIDSPTLDFRRSCSRQPVRRAAIPMRIVFGNDLTSYPPVGYRVQLQFNQGEGEGSALEAFSEPLETAYIAIRTGSAPCPPLLPEQQSEYRTGERTIEIPVGNSPIFSTSICVAPQGGRVRYRARFLDPEGSPFTTNFSWIPSDGHLASDFPIQPAAFTWNSSLSMASLRSCHGNMIEELGLPIENIFTGRHFSANRLRNNTFLASNTGIRCCLSPSGFSPSTNASECHSR